MIIRYLSGDPTTNPFNDFLKDYGIYLALAVAGVVLITVLVFVFLALKRRKATPKIEEVKVDSSGIKAALGGEDNIVSHSINGSRIVIELKDYSLVNEKSLNELGVASIIKMSNKITLVVKGNSEAFYKNLF